MADEIHPVVELLIARMDSHPEEFRDDYLMSEVRASISSGRWLRATQAIQDHGSKRDVEALNAALSKIYMQYIHDWVMDELFNGDDRRREEEEVKKRVWLQQQQMHQQAYQQSPHLRAGTQNLNQLGSYQQSQYERGLYPHQQSALLGAASPPPQPQLGEDSLMQQIRKRLIK
jgi:hypothetical protein